MPTVFENPDAILANLAKEVSLGRTAGLFDTPSFSNFQVSPIGLVPIGLCTYVSVAILFNHLSLGTNVATRIG